MDLTPRMIFWETTKRCNLHCGYCRRLTAPADQELTTPEALRLIEVIRANFGKPVLVLSGGEPLLREDIFDIMAHAARMGLPLALATNGLRLEEKEAVWLRQSGVKRVSLSFDSVDSGTHDRSRGLPGAFEKTKAAAAFLQAHAVPFQINFTLTKKNRGEVRAVADFGQTLGAVGVHYFVLVPVGCGKTVRPADMLDGEEAEDVLTRIRALAAEYALDIRPTCSPQYVRLGDPHFAKGCLAGTGVVFISSEGKVYPCGYLPVSAGSIRENSLLDIWKNAAVFQTLRQNDLKGGCGVCAWKNQCRGCRARAYGVTGDYMASDVTCCLAPGVAVS
ncbi:MAG: radical SAM protein [Candidatus Omnitrophica bacterium]|nr:radical SAM protein [Candidatus Omnitrophota bacterium]